MWMGEEEEEEVKEKMEKDEIGTGVEVWNRRA